MRNQSFSSPAGGGGEAPAIFADDNMLSRGIIIWSIDIRSVLKNSVELHARIEDAKPDLLLLQETWLGGSIDSVSLPNYTVGSREDRIQGDKRGYGGVAVLARAGAEDMVEPIFVSQHFEREWLTLHSDIGPILLGNWYRPPDGGEIDVRMLDTELSE